MRTKLFVLPLLFATALMLVQGCMTVALVGAGAGTVMYAKGDLEAVLSNDIKTLPE